MCVSWCFHLSKLRGMATTSRSRRKDDDKKSKRKAGSASQSEVEELARVPDPSDASLNDLRTAFGLLDRDSDGHVTLTELQFMLRNLGIEVKDELLQDLMKDASRAGNGLIDEAEFLQWVSKIQALQGAISGESADSEDEITRDLLAAFRVFDRDCNGYITKDELRSALEMIGEPVTDAQLTQVLALGDVDKDGKINYEEFVRLLL